MIIIETNNNIIKLGYNNYYFRTFYKNRDGGFHYSINLFLFYGKSTSNINELSRLQKIDRIYYNYNIESYLYLDLKKIGSYLNTSNKSNLQKNLGKYLDDFDFNDKIFNQNEDIGYYFYNITDKFFGSEIKEIKNIK
jgi:hypothetical protein